MKFSKYFCYLFCEISMNDELPALFDPFKVEVWNNNQSERLEHPIRRSTSFEGFIERAKYH